MQRTFCDSCGEECKGHRRAVVHLTEIHYAEANPREPVGEDNYRQVDLCSTCTTRVRRALGKALVPAERYPGLDMDSARMGVPMEDTRLVHLPDVPG